MQLFFKNQSFFLCFLLKNYCFASTYTVKKGSRVSRPCRDVTTKLSPGDGKLLNLFYGVAKFRTNTLWLLLDLTTFWTNSVRFASWSFEQIRIVLLQSGEVFFYRQCYFGFDPVKFWINLGPSELLGKPCNLVSGILTYFFLMTYLMYTVCTVYTDSTHFWPCMVEFIIIIFIYLAF